MPTLLQLAQSYSNPESVNYKLAYLREQMEEKVFGLGELAYEDQVQLAMLGDTIIVGGFLRTELIAAKSIHAEHLNVDDLSAITGKFTFLMAGDPFGARLEMGESAGEPFLDAYDSENDLRVRLLQDSLEFSAGGITGGKLEAEYFGAGVEGEDRAGLLLSSTYSIKMQAFYYARMETYGAAVQCAGEIVQAWADRVIGLNAPEIKVQDGVLRLRDPGTSISNIQLDFTGGYSLWRDATGAGGNDTRLWLDAPHAGEVVIGPRSSTSWLGRLRIRALNLRIETGSVGSALVIWGPTEPRIEPITDNYGYVGGVNKAFRQMYSYNYSQASAREAKTNIEPVNKASCYSQLREMNFWKYNLKDDVDGEGGQKEGGEAVAMKEAPTYLGVIAEESPDIICDKEKKNINLYSYISLIGAAVQEMQAKIEVLEKTISDLRG